MYKQYLNGGKICCYNRLQENVLDWSFSNGSHYKDIAHDILSLFLANTVILFEFVLEMQGEEGESFGEEFDCLRAYGLHLIMG